MFSCTKAQSPQIENNELTELSIKELLMQNSWMLVSRITKSNTWDPFASENDSITFTKYLEEVEACWKDDIHIFKKDNIYIIDDNSIKCVSYVLYKRTWQIEDANLLRRRTTYLNGQFVMSSIRTIIEINNDTFTEYSCGQDIHNGERYVTISKYEKK